MTKDVCRFRQIVLGLLLSSPASFGCNGGDDGPPTCGAHTQADVERLLAQGCVVELEGYQDPVLRITNRDAELGVSVNGLRNPLLRRVEYDGYGLAVRNVPEVVNVNSDCRAHPRATELLELELVELSNLPGVIHCFFNIDRGGHVKIRVADGTAVSRLMGGTQDSWEGVTFDIDEASQPVETMSFEDVEAGLSLEQMQAFGSKMERVLLAGGMDQGLIDSYVEWMFERAFAGTIVSRRPNFPDVQHYPPQRE